MVESSKKPRESRPIVPRLNAPGKVPDLAEWDLESAWTFAVSGLVDDCIAKGRRKRLVEPWVFNPVGATTPPDRVVSIEWTAFPKTQAETLDKYKVVDNDRDLQDEYCEWAVKRDGGKITRVTFTTETPDYFQFLAAQEPKTLAHVLALYRRCVSSKITAGDLRRDGQFDAMNATNYDPASGEIVHMGQDNNTLGAAVQLAVDASWAVVDGNNNPVTDGLSLITCLDGFGVETRNSDPHIGAQINELVREGFKVTFSDPPGLYLHSIDLSGFETPDGSDINDWLTYERGVEGFRTRASFEAPKGSQLTVSDLTLDGDPVEFGGQIAEKVRVRIEVTGTERPGRELEPVHCG